MVIYSVALTLGILFHIFIQKLFIHYKKFDAVNYRSSHNTSATRTGGIGIFLTLFVITLYQYILKDEIFDFSLLIPLSIMFIVGFYDDLYNADFKLKFLLQVIVAKLIIDQGYVIDNFYGLFGLYEVSWVLAQTSTIFVFLVIVNAINFIDGIDGLAITEVIKSIIIIELIASSDTPLRALGVVIIASTLPLYYFNFKKNYKVFLGDGGSLLLGTLIAIYIFYVLGPDFNLNEKHLLNKAMFSISLCIYPLFDLLRVFILRIINRKSPFSPDKNHLHHFLLKKFNNTFLVILIIQISHIIIFGSIYFL